MKITPAAVAFAIVLAAPSLVAAQGEAPTCVDGAFSLEFVGSCNAASVVAAYSDQVFDAVGARSAACAVDAAADLAAKLAAAGLPDAAALCDTVYAAQDQVPFANAARRGKDLRFEQEFFNGRTDWQEEVETIYETEDMTATSHLQEDAEQVRVFYDGVAQGRRVDWPGSLTNFQSSVNDADDMATCTTNAAMCCWPKDRQANDNNGNCNRNTYDENCVDKDPADNTDLCFVDPARGNASTGFDSTDGLLVYPGDNNDGEGAIHCHGLAWSNDVNDHTARYKANNLFFVSMYDHMYQRGYVQNIPGAPMCGCVEQMPTVSRSDCTQVDLTETVRITYDPDATPPFQSELTHVHVDFNACQGINNRNNDLWAYIAKLYYQGDVTPEQFGEAGRIITDSDCSEATAYHLSTLGLARGYDHDVSTWTKVAGRDAMFSGHPFGTTAFNTVFFDSSLTPAHPVLLRICPHCTETHRKVYYRRLTAAPDGVDVLNHILRYNSGSVPAGNIWKTDFTLHSTYDDAVSGAHPWECPDDNFNYSKNFVGDCSPSGARVQNQHTNFKHNGPQYDVAYYANAPDGAGVDEVAVAALPGFGAQYSDADLGTPAHAGRVFVRDADGALLLTGGGVDIWNHADAGHYLSAPFAGDVDVRVLVSAFTGIADGWAKAGIMLRADDDADATHAFGMLTGLEGVALITRRSKGAPSNLINRYQADPRQKSSWLRLVKAGDRVTFYYRDAEVDAWVEHGSDTVRFPDDAYRVGLAVTSADDAIFSEAVFEDYTVAQTAAPTPSPTGSAAPTSYEPIAEVGGATGSFSKQTDGLTIYQASGASGAGIWGRSDAFLFDNVRRDTADGAFNVVAYSNYFHTGYANAKAGIMIRDSTDPDAAHAFVGVSGNYLGVTFQTRAATGEATAHHSTRFVSEHKTWMKLSKAADSNFITAYYKINAEDAWIEIGSEEVQLTGGVVRVGTAVTSGESSVYRDVSYQEKGYQIVDMSEDAPSAAPSLTGMPTVLAPRNVITGSAVASQDSTCHGGSASRAIDGNREGNWGNNSVQHTCTSSNPWWKVDLGTDVRIAKVSVYSRTDCCWDRLGSSELQILDADGDVLESRPFEGNQLEYHFTFDNVAGRSVRVYRNVEGVLNIAEVEVSGY